MEQTKKWWQSRTVQLAGALVIASLGFVAVSFGIVDVSQLEAAQNTMPELQNGIVLIKAGQVFGGIGAIVGSLVVYFRVKANKLLTT